MTKLPSINHDAHEAAALWYARMSSDLKTPADQAAFDAWLSQSPEHQQAYGELCALSDRLAALSSHPDIAAYRVEAHRLEERDRRPLLARLGSWRTGGFIAAAAAAIVALVLFQAAPVETAAWTTARGETREITLSDGTDVVLGSDSRLAIRFVRDQRSVQLDRGQAFFDVAHDADRRFVVSANERTVTALGTAFDVRSYTNETTVTLVRGSVAIARQGEGREAVLSPGQQFQALFGTASVRDVDAEAETAWRTGILEFDNVALAEAITEFNRGGEHSILLADQRLADLRVSGVFRANDPYGFAAALTPAYNLKATRQSSGDIVLSE